MSNLVVEIKNRFQYLDGKLIHKNPHFKNMEGMEAGGTYVCTRSPFNTFRRVRVNNSRIPTHHAVWMMFNGHLPKNTRVLHINGNTLDNRIENLTLA